MHSRAVVGTEALEEFAAWPWWFDVGHSLSVALAEAQDEAIFLPPALLWRTWEPEDGRPLLLAFFLFFGRLWERVLPTTGKHPACFALAHFEATGMVSLHGFTRHRGPVSPERVSRFLWKYRKWPGKKGLSSLLGPTNALSPGHSGSPAPMDAGTRVPQLGLAVAGGV